MSDFHLTADMGLVGTGVSDARLGELTCVYKQDSAKVPHCVLNEWVSYRIAEHIGLPVPKAGMLDLHGKPAFASVNFGAGKIPVAPPRVSPAKILSEHPHFAHGIIAFDMLVANSDRHHGNLALLPSGKVVVFDHSHAIYGFTGRARLATHRDELGIGLLAPGASAPVTPGNIHCLAAIMRDEHPLDPWFDRILSLKDWFFDDLKKELKRYRLIDDATRREELMDWLKYRRDSLEYIFQSRRSHFSSLPPQSQKIVSAQP